MSTRSTYRVIEKFTDYASKKLVEKVVALIYIQCDGYPSGHPVETAEWLTTGKVVNGIGMDEGSVFNGAGCLAAQLVEKYKRGPGGCYLRAPKDRAKSGEDYTYDIIVEYDEQGYKPKPQPIFIAYEVYKRPKKIFEGSPAEFVTWVKSQKE